MKIIAYLIGSLISRYVNVMNVAAISLRRDDSRHKLSHDG